MSQAVRVCKWRRAEYEHGVQQPHLQDGPKGKEKKSSRNLAEEEMSPTPTLSAPIFFLLFLRTFFFSLPHLLRARSTAADRLTFGGWPHRRDCFTSESAREKKNLDQNFPTKRSTVLHGWTKLAGGLS
ncbi:hypothetical protein M431DRAFT_287785 [Trichoderma harzianum CBS 226.95]|uniref:Uncharacterized protein n=1 Tax=Trichoderma harzianum CBS 226.95 TaxID=983964 RepID=A0A2T4AP29_TRIHA|nr:hypothetical protein M431DRAFT_287785 [Trichoderma harzianum CBS 226.95]PTB58834.1 hypothetical protein M431DRAFT_287785 [Trichoderma harzianum CBS 226.95]